MRPSENISHSPAFTTLISAEACVTGNEATIAKAMEPATRALCLLAVLDGFCFTAGPSGFGVGWTQTSTRGRLGGRRPFYRERGGTNHRARDKDRSRRRAYLIRTAGSRRH